MIQSPRHFKTEEKRSMDHAAVSPDGNSNSNLMVLRIVLALSTLGLCYWK